jgi:hypothetical protein
MRGSNSFINDAFGVTVDEPSNPTPQTGHLTIETNDLFRRGSAVARLGNTAAVFVSHTTRVFQESPHLMPYPCSKWSLRTGRLLDTALPLNR